MHSSHPFQPALFEAIVEQIPDAVVFADRGGVIRVWNRGAEAVFGFAANEVLGQSLDVIIPERYRVAHGEGFRRAVDRGHTRHSNKVRTTRALHKDGRKLYVDLSFAVIINAAGNVAGAVAVGRDCSQRYLSEKALQEQLAALEAKQTS